MSIHFKISPRGTCWWGNDWHPKHVSNQREDKLIGVSRIYFRKFKYYAYVVHIGRLVVHIFPNLKDSK
jgi:hypothetical protein